MTQEEKSLLLQDLCARLPYGVKIEKTYVDYPTTLHEDDIVSWKIGEIKIKPYLRPMSSMTEEEHDEYIMIEYSINAGMTSKRDFTKWIDFVHSHHFDYRGLIEKGLAIEVTKENNPYD